MLSSCDLGCVEGTKTYINLVLLAALGADVLCHKSQLIIKESLQLSQFLQEPQYSSQKCISASNSPWGERNFVITKQILSYAQSSAFTVYIYLKSF